MKDLHQRPRHSLDLGSRPVLNGLTLGFLLVLLLLGASGGVAVWRSRVISENASKLTRDHLIMARLIHDVQTAQSATTEVLQRLTQPGGNPTTPLALLRNLTEDRSEMMDSIRRRLLSETGLEPARREALLEATTLFERLVWLLRRYALLLAPVDVDGEPIPS